MAGKKGLGGRVSRGAKLTRTAARGGAGFARAGLRRAMGNDDPDLVHAEVAAQVAAVLGEMKGAAMKLGQLLSFIDLDLPPEVRSVYQDALASLRDDAPPMDIEAIRGVVRQDFGADPKDIFRTFDEVPLAAASIGQVHAATLDDGRDVVVKIQYPDVADAVRADLANAELFAPMARLFSPNQEIEPLLDELRERIDDELDYQREAQYQRAFADRYRDHPFILVPDVIGDLCRRRVLVSDRIRGRKFDDVVANGSTEVKQRVGEIIFRYGFGSIGRFRLFNGDPHPGNYLITEDDRVGFIDYGSVKMFTRERFRTMRRLDDAVVKGDEAEFIRGMRDVGFIPKNAVIDESQVWEWFQLYTRPLLADQPFTFTSEFAGDVLRTTSDPRSPYYPMLRRLNMPSDYLLLTRIHLGLNSVLGRLDAKNDWLGIHHEFVADGPPATPLGELDAAWWAKHPRNTKQP